jgi:5-methylcytosine-specific restriction protein A
MATSSATAAQWYARRNRRLFAAARALRASWRATAAVMRAISAGVNAVGRLERVALAYMVGDAPVGGGAVLRWKNHTTGEFKVSTKKLPKLQKKLPSVGSQERGAPGASWRAQLSSSTARGYDYAWQKYRLDFLERNPLCVLCRERGIVRASCIVNHIIPHGGDPILFRDTNNHEALCKPCHDSIVQAREHAQRFGR